MIDFCKPSPEGIGLKFNEEAETVKQLRKAG
jgi:hypothetical protein